MCGKSQSTTSTSSPNPAAMQAYQGLLSQASGVAGLPFTPYGGEFVAPMNAQQNLAGANINQNAGFANPFIQQARQYATQAATPITGSNINQYLSPYTQDVVNATQAQFNNQNKQQLENVRGNAIAQGALGGDREAVAEANLSNQQNLSQAPVIAGLYNQGYNTALSTALQEQQNLGQSAYSLGNLGVAGQNAALTGANAQLGFGTLGQSTQQAQDQALYSQFLAQQGYPFQVAQWLAGIDTAVGSQMGGTSTTTGPAPNPWSSIAGLALAGMSMSDRRAKHDVHQIGKTRDGQPIYRFRYKDDPSGRVHVGLMAQDVEKRHPEAVAGFGGVKYVDYDAATKDAAKRHGGGRIPGFAFGGMPYSGGSSYIPTMGLTMGQGAPKPPSAGGGQQQPDPFKLASSTMDLEKKIKGLGGSGSGDDGILYGGEALGLNQDYSAPEGILYGPEALGLDSFARGGKIRGFAGGGLADDLGGDDIPSFDDRFSGIVYDPRADQRERAAAMDSLRPGEQPEGGLGLGDIASSYAPGFENNFGNDLGEHPGASLAGPPPDYVNPSYVNGQAQNLTGPIIPPGGFGPAPDLPPATEVADTRPRGLDTAAMSFAPEPGSNPIRGYAPVPGSQGAPSIPGGEGEKHAGFGLLDKLGIHLDPNMRRGLLAAGLGMMASRSPYLGVAIGEGGLAGLSAYHGAEKEQRSVEDARKKLEMHAEEFQKKLALDTKKVAQQEEHMQLLREQAEKGRIPPGYERVESGLRALPGGPADPEAAAKLAAAKKGATTDLPEDAWNVHGDEFLKYLPPAKQNLVKGVANYDIDPKTLSVIGGHREEALNFAKQYDPNFDQKTYNQRYNAVNKFATGPQGQNLTSLNTTIYHLDTLEKAVDALNNGNVQAFNQVSNFLSRQFGYPQVTNFQGVRDIAADEVVRSVLGVAGSEEDRRSMRESILAAGSPAQLHGIIDKYQDMMAGRLHSLRYTFKDATGLNDEAFDRKLTPETRERLSRLEANVGKPGGVGPAAGGGNVPAGAAAYLRAHPELRQQFDAKYGAGASAQILGQ